MVWTHADFKTCHDVIVTRAAIAHSDLQPPTTIKDTEKTLQIYVETLHPTLHEWIMNAVPHNNDAIRQSHYDTNVRIVGYHVTPAEKETIKDIIGLGYRREQNK